jgi:hypothetical protein
MTSLDRPQARHESDTNTGTLSLMLFSQARSKLHYSEFCHTPASGLFNRPNQAPFVLT